MPPDVKAPSRHGHIIGREIENSRRGELIMRRWVYFIYYIARACDAQGWRAESWFVEAINDITGRDESAQMLKRIMLYHIIPMKSLSRK